MSSSQDSETKRAVLDKVQEGHRLLSAGDYEGAIEACTEAIELDPRMQDAYRTRTKALKIVRRNSDPFYRWKRRNSLEEHPHRSTTWKSTEYAKEAPGIRGLPAILIGAGIVVGGIVTIVKVHPFVGSIFILVGVAVIITRKIGGSGRYWNSREIVEHRSAGGP